MFMSPEELIELTDYKLASHQCRWLTEHGYPFDTSASGRPKVLRSYLEQRLCPQTTTSNSNEPDFEALNR
ncbi:DUF4224 domain-containing protein [Methyloradius palustris]|uniref:DUF4224 domain-containing protein n=1 Tax=Methyloradius palustris TaxID=2778876 RepID=A0A8D5FXI1_9PROT|nr:DUF4224 domain-containing protein [Methyloradius palustris]BCM23822.1 hypothetical protein ZMTM_00810 [Methyloradius palustris]